MRFAIATLLLALGCADEAPEAAPTGVDLSERVTFSDPGHPDHVVVATLPAEIVAAPGGTARIGPGVEGRITAWRVAAGDVVAAGAPLAELRSPELAERAAAVVALEARRERAAEVLAVAEAAREAGVGDAPAVAEARRALGEVDADLEAARRALSAHRDTATAAGAAWVWRSPAAGAVAEIDCALDGVTADRACITLVDPDAARLRVMVPERLLPMLEGPVEAGFVGVDGVEVRFEERDRAPSLDPATRARRFHFTVAEGVPPLVGAAGRVRLRVPAGPDLAALPAEALARIDDGDVVYVEDAADGARAVPVTRVGFDGDAVVVRGLPADARVATRGVFLLRSLQALEGA